MPIFRPTGITANRDLCQLEVTWEDSHVSMYPFSLVRNACPCAECRGGHDKMGGEPEAEVFYMPLVDSPATRMKSIDLVGGYGLTIEWEDGHHFGIYNWPYLRSLCPCPLCRMEFMK